MKDPEPATAELKAAGSCDVCRLTDWWFCECAEGTERDNSPMGPLTRTIKRLLEPIG